MCVFLSVYVQNEEKEERLNEWTEKQQTLESKRIANCIFSCFYSFSHSLNLVEIFFGFKPPKFHNFLELYSSFPIALQAQKYVKTWGIIFFLFVCLFEVW